MVWLPTSQFITTNGVTHAAKERKVGLQNSELIGNTLLRQGRQLYVWAIGDQSPVERYTLFILPEICVSPFWSFFRRTDFIFKSKNFFPFFFDQCRYGKRYKIIKVKLKFTSHDAASSGPHFLVWASLKLRITADSLHSRFQWPRL